MARPGRVSRPPPQKEAVKSPFNLEAAIVTDHAVERFTKRFKEIYPGKELYNPKQTILELLGRAKEEGAIGRGMKVKRLMAHDYEEVRYFLSEGWRFIVLERDGKFVIKTIESKKPKR